MIKNTISYIETDSGTVTTQQLFEQLAAMDNATADLAGDCINALIAQVQAQERYIAQLKRHQELKLELAELDKELGYE